LSHDASSPRAFGRFSLALFPRDERRTTVITSKGTPKDELDEAFDKLEREMPDVLTRVILWLRKPQARWIRLPLGVLCIIASFFWFLPVIGLEYLPIGLLLIAQDVPILREPAGRFMLWVLDRMKRLKNWYKRKR
jgi:hypothetical protein